MSKDAFFAVAGLFPGTIALEPLLHRLIESGISREEVCVLLPQIHSVAHILHSLRSGNCSLDAAPEIGAVIEWLSQFGAVIIPKVGMFVAAREFVGTLFGSANGEHACDNALQELRLSRSDVHLCENWMRGGGTIMYITCHANAGVDVVTAIFEEAGAKELLYSAQVLSQNSAFVSAS